MSETAIISVHVQAFHSDVVEQEWKPFSSGYTQLILYRKQNFFRIVGRNVEEGNFVINTRISPDDSIYEKITDTFHQYSDDGQTILGFNFYSQDHADEFFNGLENAMEEAETYQSKRCSEVSPKNRSNDDEHTKEMINHEEGSFAEILKSVKLNKTNNDHPPERAPIEEESDLVSEIQKKLNRRKNGQDEEFVDPLAKKDSAPKETVFDFRSHLKHKELPANVRNEDSVGTQSERIGVGNITRESSDQALKEVQHTKEKKQYEEPPNFDKVNEFKSIASNFEKATIPVNANARSDGMSKPGGSETDIHTKNPVNPRSRTDAALREEILEIIRSELEKTKVEIINEVGKLLRSS